MTTTPESSLASPEGVAFVRRLGVNTLAQTVGLGAGTVLGFATFVAVTRGLGPEAFGDLTAATVYLMFPVALADIGLATGVLREISVTPDRTTFVIRASLPLRFLIAVAVIAASLAVSVFLPFSDRAQTAIWLSALASLFTLLSLGLQPMFQARLQMHIPVAASVAGRVLTLALILLVFATGRGFTAVVLAYVVGAALNFGILFAAAARQIPLRPLLDTAYWSTLLRGSLAIGLATGLFLSYYRIDTVLVALLRDPHETGLYGAAFKFVEIAELLVAAVGISVFPTFARLIATRDQRINGAIQRSLDAVLAFTTPIVVAILLAADDLVTATAGPEFAPAATALRLLMPYLVLLVVTGILIRVAAALHEDRFLLVVAVTVLLVNVALNVALLPTYGYEVAALTSLFSEACAVLALAWVVWRRLAFVPSLRYVWLVGLAAAAMVGSYWILPLAPLLALTVASIVYGALLLIFPGAVRETAGALLPRVFGRPQA